MNKNFTTRVTRIIRKDESSKIMYIKHLGREPYNEVKFECGKKLIVSYSLSYWHSIFEDFHRISKSVLVNPKKIISRRDSRVVELTDNTKFNYSRRKHKSLFS